ncbi:MAG: DUF739 family protein [Oscillospiraceae bacterium]|nr:DUF739 family protein [Oscillospiraceae bacterium]
MIYEYDKLLCKITKVFGTQMQFAAAIGLSERALSQKLCGASAFNQSEIMRSCKLLKINDRDIQVYFFTLAGK